MSKFNSKISFVIKVFKAVVDISLTTDVTFTKGIAKQTEPEAKKEAVLVADIKTEYSEEKTEAPLAVHQPRPQRTPEMLNSISERIKQVDLETKLAEEPELSITIEDEILTADIECSMCGSNQFINKECKSCESPICEGCAVVSIEDGVNYCESCWDSNE